jgi:hypothetical protein
VESGVKAVPAGRKNPQDGSRNWLDRIREMFRDWF